MTDTHVTSVTQNLGENSCSAVEVSHRAPRDDDDDDDAAKSAYNDARARAVVFRGDAVITQTSVAVCRLDCVVSCRYTDHGGGGESRGTATPKFWRSRFCARGNTGAFGVDL